MHSTTIPLDYRVITGMVKPGSTVLDLGCGEGELLSLLETHKNCRVQGIEINDREIYRCVARGLSVFHGDIDSGLADFAEGSFDYVILNQSLQEIMKIEAVLKDALRVGKMVIVGFPNFAYYTSRFQIFFKGTTPVTPSLPYTWYDTPNLHFLSILDFTEYCHSQGISIVKACYTGRKRIIRFFPNLFAKNGIFLVHQSRN